jgi:GNAT superfamily N-acetyltransferase
MTSIRPATAADRAFIEEMFVLTADWNPERVRGALYWRADPTFEKYVGGFPRASDLGLIAEYRGQDAGAAWSRFFTEHDPGYGFVDDATPELGIAVVPGLRGKGIGRALLEGMIAASTTDLSLSVEDGNPAIELYRSCGFEPVGRFGEATTMLRKYRGSHTEA